MKNLAKKIFVGTISAMTLLTGCSVGGNSNNKDSDKTSDIKANKPIYTIDSSKPIIALTFDDGPNTTTTNEVLDKLEKYEVRASFFVIGNNITPETEVVIKRAYGMGCEINNHSKTHPAMNKMTVDEIKEEIEYTNAKILEVVGEKSKFFRPPYIAVNDVMLETIDEVFIAGIGSNDWDESVSAVQRAQKILDQVKDGHIILLHDSQGNSKTVEALDILIPKLKELGYQFATVSELFEAKGVAISTDDNKVYTNALQSTLY